VWNGFGDSGTHGGGEITTTAESPTFFDDSSTEPPQTLSFVPRNLPTGVPGCDAPRFCICGACKGEAPTDLTWVELNEVRDLVHPFLIDCGFPLQSGYVSEWGESYHRISFGFLRNDTQMLALRPRIESVVADFLANSDHPLIQRVGLDAFSFIGTGSPPLMPVIPRPDDPVIIPPPQPFSLEDVQWTMSFYHGGWWTYVGEETFSRIRVADPDNDDWESYVYEDLPEPVTVFVFTMGEMGEMRFGIAANSGEVYSGTLEHSSWGRMSQRILPHDPNRNRPQLYVTEITETGLTYSFINQTRVDFAHGPEYELHVREGDNWRHINYGRFWHQPAYSIPALSMFTESSPWGENQVWFGWYFDGGVIPPGEYLLVKPVNIGAQMYKLEYRFTVE
jgi:hypothetical protein